MKISKVLLGYSLEGYIVVDDSDGYLNDGEKYLIHGNLPGLFELLRSTKDYEFRVPTRYHKTNETVLEFESFEELFNNFPEYFI